MSDQSSSSSSYSGPISKWDLSPVDSSAWDDIIIKVIRNVDLASIWQLMSMNENVFGILGNDNSNGVSGMKHISIRCMALNPNPKALEILSDDEIDADYLAQNTNPEAIKLYIEKMKAVMKSTSPYKINWVYLSSNPAAMDLLKENKNKINWATLSENPAAMDLLKANPEKINWDYLCSNTNPEAIEMLEKNLDMVNWKRLSSNPAAINLLSKNKNKINWNFLHMNPAALSVICRNPDKINYGMLIYNKAFIDIFIAAIKRDIESGTKTELSYYMMDDNCKSKSMLD